MELKDYYIAELSEIGRRLEAYMDYGYSPELEPIVKALKTCYDTLKKEFAKIDK